MAQNMSSPFKISAPPATVGDRHLGLRTSALLSGVSDGLGLVGFRGVSSGRDLDVFGSRLCGSAGNWLRSMDVTV